MLHSSFAAQQHASCLLLSASQALVGVCTLLLLKSPAHLLGSTALAGRWDLAKSVSHASEAHTQPDMLLQQITDASLMTTSSLVCFAAAIATSEQQEMGTPLTRQVYPCLCMCACSLC